MTDDITDDFLTDAAPSTALIVRRPLDKLPTEFVDFTGSGPAARPKDTYRGALAAIGKLGLDCSFNIFKNEYLISGSMLANDVGELSDGTCLDLRHLIREAFDFEPSKANMQDAAMRACRIRTFHPIRNYLASVKWDGTPRVENLLRDYLNSKDTGFNRAVSRITMMASVRRILKPGTKFDYMLVLNSDEGFNKSTAIETLYGGSDYYTDQSIIGLNPQQTEEVLRGRWASEAPELTGLSKADWNALKAALSRTHDRTRRVYDRNPISGARTSIQWATSNDDTYLRALSGENRRFFSIDVLAMIDVDKILRDRDQLWAEAVVMEATGESVMLPEAFWAEARRERLLRTEEDPWVDEFRYIDRIGKRELEVCKRERRISDHYSQTETEQRISTQFCLGQLGLHAKDIQPQHGSRLNRVMKSLGWERPPGGVRIGSKNQRGYKRTLADDLM